MSDDFNTGNFSQAWFVLVLAVVIGAALAAVQVNLSPKIAANKMNETLEKIPELVSPVGRSSGSGENSADLEIDDGSFTRSADGKVTQYAVFRVTQNGQPLGWVVKASGQGYADRIELLIGLDPGLMTITGLFVLEQKETPGLGNKIVLPEWRNQFIGKTTHPPLRAIKGTPPSPETIDAVTGATISSRSVTAIVNKTIRDLHGRLTPETFRQN